MATPSGQTVDLSKAMIMQAPPLVDWLVIAPVVLCIAMGALLMILRKRTDIQAVLAIAGLVALVLIDMGLLVHVVRHGPITMTMGRWLPPFGISFTADTLGAMLALASGLAALACGINGIADVDDSGKRYGFYPFLFLMMAGVSGSFLTGDIFNLYVWFEVLLISSFGLLVLGSERGQIDGATKYAFLNLVATTLFLIATAYLYGIFGTLNMADIVGKVRTAHAAPLMTLAVLYFLAFGMKAAAFPVNFWLPASYHTPRVVASALFAGILTKVGVYALMRTLVMLFPPERAELSLVIGIVAALTMIVGVLGALAQSDLRRLLGYLVISGIGVILSGVAIASAAALAGAIVYMMHSMIVMTALYIASGIAARAAGRSLSIATLVGFYRSNPLLSALTLVLFFSVSGLPPFSGLWPKVMLVKASFDAGEGWLGASILLTSFLTVIAVMRVWALAYWRPHATVADGEAAVRMSPDFVTCYLPLLLLVALTVGFGLFPDMLIGAAQTAAHGLLDPAAYVHSVFPRGEIQ